MPSFASPGRLAALVALAVFACTGLLGVLTHREPALPMPAAKARRLAERDPRVRPLVQGATRVKVLRVDDRLVKVVWYRGTRLIAWTGVRTSGAVLDPARNDDGRIGYGAPVSHAPAVLAALTLLFLLATLRGPLRSRRTLDVLAIAAFVVPTVLIDRWLMTAGQALAAALLAYLLLRGVATAWRGATDDHAGEPVLLDRLAARLAQPRLAMQLALALLVAILLVTATSTGVIDVAVANMEGATLLLHGVVPYGHMPGDVVHGDTYGLPIYAIYAPVAAIWPVHDGWDDATGSLVLATVAIVVAAMGFDRALRGARWTTLIAVLAFPAVLMSVSSGTNDVLVGAALIWAFAWFARPAAATALLTGAGLAKVAPILVLPLWLARLRGAELRAAVLASAGVGLVVLAALVAIGGAHAPLDMLHAMAFQLGRQSEMSLWGTVLDGRILQPVVQAVVLAIALGGAALLALDREAAADPRRVAGLVVAVLAGLQLAANHWMPLYLLWLAPPAMVALLGPLGLRDAVGARAQGLVPAVRPTGAVCPSSATLSRARSPVPSSPPAA